ncbi:MAG: hypothetical protein ACE5OS_10915 [Anaerolineae bacterium]
MKTRHVTLLFLVVLALVACGPTPQPIAEEAGGPSTPAQPALGESPLTEPGPGPDSPLPTPPADVVDAAMAYLAAELGIAPEEVTIFSFEPVEWPDAGLGCPQPGMMYAQVITPGYRLLLEVAGEQYEVHTDRTGQSVVICLPTSGDLSDPQIAFQTLLAYLTQTAPGFGLGQREGWVREDITEPGLVGASVLAWRSGEWTLEMSFPVVPHPSYESVLTHQRAGAVWSGTLRADGQVTPVYEPLSLSFDVGECDETITLGAMPPDWEGVQVVVQDGAIHLEQNLSYVCCAELTLVAGRDGEVIKVVETNVGEVCRCICGYTLTADLTGLEPGTYTVEVWGVQHFDVHPLELLGSGEATVP